MATPEFVYQDPFPLGEDTTNYRLVSTEGVSVVEFEGKKVLKVTPEAIELLSRTAMHDVSFFLRPAHNEQVAKILKDPEASQNDKGVAMAMLRNAQVAAEGQLPTCQHRHRKRRRQEGPTGLDRIFRRRSHLQRHLQHLHAGQSAVQPDRRAGHVQGDQHRHKPSRAD